ncbi:MAG TPA: hypothetical protein VNS60_09830 [Solirubrobacterales bacterium]|nr:hypothetical protein [Solirubrobacterales bacterium]
MSFEQRSACLARKGLSVLSVEPLRVQRRDAPARALGGVEHLRGEVHIAHVEPLGAGRAAQTMTENRLVP